MDIKGDFISANRTADVVATSGGKRKTICSPMNEPVQKHSAIHRPIAAAFGGAPRKRFEVAIHGEATMSSFPMAESTAAEATGSSHLDTKEKRIDDYFPHEYSSFGVYQLFSASGQKVMESQMDICPVAGGSPPRCASCSNKSSGDNCSFCSKMLCSTCFNICASCQLGFCGQCSTIIYCDRDITCCLDCYGGF